MPDQVNYKHELVGVFGYPVAENPTGVMIEPAFAALGLQWRYQLFEVKPDDLADAVRALRALNMRGINLTIPHKVNVLQYLDEVSPDARLMGAVNMVHRQGERLIGENTDGKGFLKSLREDAGVDPHGKRVVVLGAGGAARAITVELALAGAQHITIVNRSAGRGQTLVNLLNRKPRSMPNSYCGKGAMPCRKGLMCWSTPPPSGCTRMCEDYPNLDYDTIHPAMTVCDVIPNPPHTPFLKQARQRGAKTLDGLGMLVNQGAIGFKIWTGQDAPVEVMHQALREAFHIAD
jgi:shikimate dehydrogenase